MPLVEKCKRLGRAIRIGTNHGSLSARILSYYGDTPRYAPACVLRLSWACGEQQRLLTWGALPCTAQRPESSVSLNPQCPQEPDKARG